MNRAFRHCSIVALGTLASGATADAYEFRVRFVERIGSNNIELHEGHTIYMAAGEERRIRIQFGVFDDAAGAAPAGGFFGWNLGSITVNGWSPHNSDEFRNSPQGAHNGVGRLPPFNSAPASGGANGLPAQDPFEALTGIDNTLGNQSLIWNFGQPQPQPVIRGLNTWVSTYEISIHPNAGALPYTIGFGGSLLAATSWISGEPVPPQGPDQPGSVTYSPILTTSESFGATLLVAGLPSPSAATLFVLGGMAAIRRRR
jgi:hypothetical protein